jgi:hypothetical protein
MSTPVGCTLYVDGARVADGTPGDPEAAPTALSGLSLSWGRTTTVDQVEPSTCSFELMDPPGGGSFLNLLYTGARVDVVASAAVPGQPGQPVNVDGGFEAAATGIDLHWTNLYSGHYGQATAARAHTGAHSATIIDRSATPNAVTFDSGVIPPAPPSSDPSAWDHIPVLHNGDVWTAAAWLYPPIGGTVAVQAAVYASPSAQASRYGTRLDLPWQQAQSWQPAALTYTGGTGADDGKWLGVGLTLTFAAWNAIGAIPAVTWAAAPGSWADWRGWSVDDVAVIPPDDAAPRRDVLVFSGRVTDLVAGWDESPPAVVCGVTAADFTADLAQRDVGAEPWPAEHLDDRFYRIVTAADMPVRYSIEPSLADWRVSYLDVDRQQAWPLLADLATSVDGVLWAATHRTTGPYLWLADPRVQAALYELYLGDDGLVHVAPTSSVDRAIEVDACDVLLGPVLWRQAVSDVTTRVAVSWQDQTVDPDTLLPAPTERNSTVVDATLEARLGTRRAAVSTLLTTADDAVEVAALLLGRLHLQSWRVGGLTWRTDLTDMNPDQVVRTLDLLDGTRRLGAAVLLTNLADWSPTGGGTLPLLLQGGQYTFEDGQWTLELVTSSAASQGASLPWTALDPTWAWNEFAPDVAWTDLAGVAA